MLPVFILISFSPGLFAFRILYDSLFRHPIQLGACSVQNTHYYTNTSTCAYISANFIFILLNTFDILRICFTFCPVRLTIPQKLEKFQV